MRISRIMCDGCGKEIHGNPLQIIIERVDRETGDFDYKSAYIPKKDFCDECMERIKQFVEGTAPKEPEVEEPKPADPIVEESKPEEPVPEEPVPEEPIQEEPAPEEPKPEDFKPERPKAKLPKPEKPDYGLNGKKPTVKELVLAGMSKEEVCRITGCSPQTYHQTKYNLKKAGIAIQEPNEESETDGPQPVKCSEVGKQCEYGAPFEGKIACDFIGKTGHMRGCPTEACIKFERKGR